ncbi:hypothetical protein F5X68DRAFT_17003 [Plectosphaerella plurivora]|uniref:Uncharacterized protein n=1 Tax=Plectosphaerella plurivora TaxID=936078 RepID=A0A9P8VBJ4_9PEZI|nr:hypothetical protein F5X68DRAFT_17003 [Plectosphaerella plurivora]
MGKSYKKGMFRPGPVMPDQPNTDAIEKSMNAAKAMSKAQKKKLVKAAKAKKDDDDDGGDDDDDDDGDDDEEDGKGKRKAGNDDDEEEDKRLRKQKKKVKIAINDVPMKPASGKIKHHCPQNIHKTQAQCASAKCSYLCPNCQSVVSNYGGSACRKCGQNAWLEAREQALRRKEDEEAEERKKEAARKKAENTKRKVTRKMTRDEKERRDRITAEAQKKEFEERKKKAEEEEAKALAKAQAQAKMVTTAGIKKNTGRFGSKAKKAKKSRRKFWSGMSEDDVLTVKVAMLLYRHCQDLIWKF